MNKETLGKLKKTSQGVRKVTKLVSTEVEKKPEDFITKWSQVFEAVVEIMEVFDNEAAK